MANKIILKRTSVQGRIPTTADLDLGELAINTYDGRFFAKKNDGSASIIDLKQNDPIRVLGDATSTYAWDQNTYTSNVTMTLNTVNSNTGTFGDNTNNVLTVPVITVNSKGLVTAVSTTTFSAAANLGTMATQNDSNVDINGGSIDNVSIGLGIRSYGGFTEIHTDYDAEIGGNITIAGNAEVTKNLTVTGKFYSNDITAASITVDGNTVITGNLTVQGTSTIVNSTTVAVGDLNIELAKDAVNAAQANGAGLTVIGPTTPATFTYNGTNDSWNVNKKLNGTNADFSGTVTAGAFSAPTVAGEIQPNSDGANAGGIVFPANPGGGSNDQATIRYYVDNGSEGTVLEVKVTNDTGGAGGIDYIRLNATGGTTVNNTLTADELKSVGLTSGRITFAGTGGLLVDDADLTYNSTTNTVSVPNLNIGANAYVANTLTVDGQAVIGNLTITGTTNLSNLATSNALVTEVVYGGTNGVLKGEAAFTYNETTNTLSIDNISGKTVSLTGTALYTTNTYTTGAFSLAGDASFGSNVQVKDNMYVAGTMYKSGYEVLNTADTIDGGTY